MKPIMLLLLSLPLYAQSTPYLGLNVPASNTPNWNVLANQNFTMLDSFLSGGAPLPALKTSTAGVFTNRQMNEYMQSLINNCSPLTEFHAVQQGHQVYGTEAITGCMAVPSGSTVTNGNAVAGYANTSANSASRTVGNAVAGYFQCRNLANNSACWGINPLVQDSASLTGHNMSGIELDMNLYGSPAFFKGYYLTGTYDGGTVPKTASGFEISLPYQLPYGFACDRGSCKIGLNLFDTSTASPSGSQSVQFTSHNSSGTSLSGQIYQDQNGNLILSPSPISGVVKVPSSVATNTLNQISASQFAGTSACSSDTKTISLPIRYSSQPAILVFDETTAGGVKLIAKSNSGFTVSCAGSTDTFDWIVVGNPN